MALVPIPAVHGVGFRFQKVGGFEPLNFDP